MIWVDYDNTLVNTIYAWIDYLNKNGKQLDIRQLQKYDCILQYDRDFEFFKRIGYDKKTIVPFDGAKEFLEKLKEFDDVTILSDTYELMRKTKLEHIKYFFGDNIRVKFSLGSKWKYVEKNDILIDDKFLNIYLAILNSNAHGICFNRNNEYNWCGNIIWTHQNYYLTSNYDEILNYVKNLLNN